MAENWKSLATAGLLAASTLTSDAGNLQSKLHKRSNPVAQTRPARKDTFSWPSILNAIHRVEASGQMNPQDGDNGRAIGPFQIHEPYWAEALSFDPSLGGTYQDCRNYNYAKRVVLAYLKGYGRKAGVLDNPIALARIHNGGPRGHLRSGTKSYAQKFMSALGN